MRRAFWLAALVPTLILIAGVPRSEAQGFFDGLFGGGNQQAPVDVPQRSMSLPPPNYNHRTPLHAPLRERSERRDEGSEKKSSGRYRTLCVRMCDGYYFPISYATSRGGFYKDANICRAQCGEEAKLFFHDRNDRDVRDMVDVSGKSYVRLPMAFIYRKRLVEGCRCKADPWSQSEFDRHRSYALSQTPSEGGGESTGEAKAKKKLTGPSDPAVRAVFAKEQIGQPDATELTAASAAASDNAVGNEPPAEKEETSSAASGLAGSKPTAKAETAAATPLRRANPREAPARSRTSGARPGTLRPTSARVAAPATKVQPFGLGVGGEKRWPGE